MSPQIFNFSLFYFQLSTGDLDNFCHFECLNLVSVIIFIASLRDDSLLNAQRSSRWTLFYSILLDGSLKHRLENDFYRIILIPRK